MDMDSSLDRQPDLLLDQDWGWGRDWGRGRNRNLSLRPGPSPSPSPDPENGLGRVVKSLSKSPWFGLP